mgnify:CR=1 FL=1
MYMVRSSPDTRYKSTRTQHIYRTEARKQRKKQDSNKMYVVLYIEIKINKNEYMSYQNKIYQTTHTL